MPITKIELDNFTVFEKIAIPFQKGINVLVKENGFGKTHIMKVLYAACRASRHDVSFSQKIVMVFRPDNSMIGRLVNRKKSENNTAKVAVTSDSSRICMNFSTKTKKWEADVLAEQSWEKQMSDLTSVFIPAKEILSNAWNLESAVKMGNVEFDDTYLDLIAAAKIDISRGADSVERKKYLEVKKKESTSIQYCSLYHRNGAVQCEISEKFAALEHNAIMETFRQLYMDEMEVKLQ